MNLSGAFGGARSCFRQLPESWSMSRTAVGRNAYARGKNTYVQWYIDLFRSRARSKGIGFTSLFLCVTSRYPLAVFVLLMSFPFSRSIFRRSPTLRRYANLRFEKLIARPSTCLYYVPPPVLPDLLKSPCKSIVGCYDAQCTYAPLLQRWMCDSAGASHLRDTFMRGFSGMGSAKDSSLESECEVSVNDRKLKNVFCILTWPTNVTNVLPRPYTRWYLFTSVSFLDKFDGKLYGLCRLCKFYLFIRWSCMYDKIRAIMMSVNI